jgi:hypothetical protein
MRIGQNLRYYYFYLCAFKSFMHCNVWHDKNLCDRNLCNRRLISIIHINKIHTEKYRFTVLQLLTYGTHRDEFNRSAEKETSKKALLP